MSGSMRFMTIDSSREVVRQLYRKTEAPFYECQIMVFTPRLDDVQSSPVTLHITRLRDTGAVYKLANGDRIYRTTARISPDGEQFDIDVIIRSREASVTSATISVSNEINRIIANQR